MWKWGTSYGRTGRVGRYAALLLHIKQFIGWTTFLFVIRAFLAVIAEFIQHSLGKNYHKDVLPALLNGLKVPHHLHPLSREELSVELQATVKERRMSCFHFARTLLQSKATQPLIFDFTEHTGGESFECELCQLGALLSALFNSDLCSPNSFCIQGRIDETSWCRFLSTGPFHALAKNWYWWYPRYTWY